MLYKSRDQHGPPNVCARPFVHETGKFDEASESNLPFFAPSPPASGMA